MDKKDFIVELEKFLDDSSSITDLIQISDIANNLVKYRLSKKEISLKELLAYKDRVTPQKFANVWQKEMNRVLGYSSPKSLYATFDAYDGTTSIEEKYATESERGISFPQSMNLDVKPDIYLLSLFRSNGDLMVSKVTGDVMHTSIMYDNSTPAHADNPNQRRNSFKSDSPEMKFLESHRNIQIETILKNAKFVIK